MLGSEPLTYQNWYVATYLLMEVETVTMMSAREFNCDVSAAKWAADRQPVVITDRGEPAYVQLSFDEYRRMGERGTSPDDRLCMEDDLDIEFEPAHINLRVPEL